MNLQSHHFKALKRSIERWQGTPYVSGQNVAGEEGGVDCVRLCDSILQETCNMELSDLPRNSQDSAYHDKSIVQETQRLLFQRFDLVSISPDDVILPGDLIVCTQISKEGENLHPGHHIMISSTRRNCFVDAWPGATVREMGLGAVKSAFTITKIWRSRMLYDV